MNIPRERSNIDRLLAALRRQKTDRTPNFDVWFGKRLISHVFEKPDYPYNFWDMPPKDAVALVQKIGQDAILCPTVIDPLPDGSILSAADFDAVRHRRLDTGRLRDMMSAYIAATAGTGVGVAARLTGPMVQTYMACGPVPIQSFMLQLYDDPELVEDMFDHYVERSLQTLEAIEGLDYHFFYIGDDVCDNNGFLTGPGPIKELWAPRHRKVIEAAKATGKPIMVHCCGRQQPVLPYLVDWGVDATHPLQSGVNDIYAIAEEYAGKLALVGNMSVPMLSFGTREQVVTDTLEHLRRLGPGSAYVACSDHSVIDSIRPELYLAMVETVHQHG